MEGRAVTERFRNICTKWPCNPSQWDVLWTNEITDMPHSELSGRNEFYIYIYIYVDIISLSASEQ